MESDRSAIVPKLSALALIKMNYSRPDLLQLESVFKQARSVQMQQQATESIPVKHRRAFSLAQNSQNVATSNRALLNRIEGISRRKSEYKFPVIEIKSARSYKVFEDRLRIERENEILSAKIDREKKSKKNKSALKEEFKVYEKMRHKLRKCEF